MALGQRLFITMSRGAGRLQGTLWALVFLGVLVGMVVPSPAGTRTNSTLLDSRGWGTLLSRSRAGLAGEIAGVNWESGYLVGIKRQRRLYCNVGIGFHLQVPPDGRISGTHEENPYSECKLQPVGKLGAWVQARLKDEGDLLWCMGPIIKGTEIIFSIWNLISRATSPRMTLTLPGCRLNMLRSRHSGVLCHHPTEPPWHPLLQC